MCALAKIIHKLQKIVEEMRQMAKEWHVYGVEKRQQRLDVG